MSYTSHKTIPQRFTGLAVVAGFHLVVVYLLATGLGGKLVEHTQEILQTKVIEEVKEVEDEPPPPPPDMKEPPPFIPPPEVSIAMDAAPAAKTAISVVSNKVAPPAPAPVSAEVKPKPSKRNTIPPYPQASTRLGEQGVCVLQLLIDAEGRVSDIRLVKSSGFKRLDDAALKYVKRAWRFTPGTKDGKPAPMWITQPVRFVLK